MNCSYTPAEKRADAAVHFVGVGFAAVGVAWLFHRILGRPLSEAVPLGFYGLVLLATLGISAAYNLAEGAIKPVLRRIDHAMIFVMIAGTYTPFIVLRLPEGAAAGLGAVVGGGCAIGAILKLAFPRRLDRLSVALYLGIGWAFVWALPALIDSISAPAFSLLVAGGVLYTLGALFCLLERMPYHNAAWHACVVAGASAHFATIAVEFTQIL